MDIIVANNPILSDSADYSAFIRSYGRDSGGFVYPVKSGAFFYEFRIILTGFNNHFVHIVKNREIAPFAGFDCDTVAAGSLSFAEHEITAHDTCIPTARKTTVAYNHVIAGNIHPGAPGSFKCNTVNFDPQ